MAGPVAALAKTRLFKWAISLLAGGLTAVIAVVTGVVMLIIFIVGASTASSPTTGSSTSGAGGGLGASGWANPAVGPITDGFGGRDSPGGIGSTNHKGVDIGPPCGAPIRAAHAGTVVAAARNGGYGNWVLIDHGGGISTGYAHILDGGTLVHTGQLVAAGQQIARVGTTGSSTGCHLHFEVRQNGIQIDPMPFMAGVGITLGTDPANPGSR